MTRQEMEMSKANRCSRDEQDVTKELLRVALLICMMLFGGCHSKNIKWFRYLFAWESELLKEKNGN